MATALLPSGTVFIDDNVRAEAQTVTKRIHDRPLRKVQLVLEDGAVVALPVDLANLVSHVVHGLSRGAVSVTTLPDVLTTTTAAELLGVSRPTLMKWVRAGDIDSHQVGTHTRLKLDDVLTFGRALRAKRESAFASLRAWEVAFDMG